MGLFGFFKKKKTVQPELAPLGNQQPVDHGFPPGGNIDVNATYPSMPADMGLQPERPQSFNDSDMQHVLTKLDLISTQLQNVTQRLESLERLLQGQQQNPPGPQYQEHQGFRRW